MTKCGICHRKCETGVVERVLTQADKNQIASQGGAPLEKCVYCAPCQKMLSDPIRATNLMLGLIILQARAQNPEAFNNPVDVAALNRKYLAKLLGKVSLSKGRE